MKLDISRSDLIDAMLKFERLCDETQHWIAVRIDPDGSVRVSEEPSRCVSESEYYHRMPHTVTVLSRSASGGCDGDWDNEDFVQTTIDALCDLIPEIEQKLIDAGYEVEVV